MMIRKLLVPIACAILVTMSPKAQALSCDSYQKAVQDISRAKDKMAIGDTLVRLGAGREDAENAMRASPDLEAAQTFGLRLIAPLGKSCQSGASKKS